jgi:hypothetical protein
MQLQYFQQPSNIIYSKNLPKNILLLNNQYFKSYKLLKKKFPSLKHKPISTIKITNFLNLNPLLINLEIQKFFSYSIIKLNLY